MRDLLLSDIKLGLDDLLTKRKKALLQSKVGRVYAPELVKLRQAIGELPAIETAKNGVGDRLSKIDDIHDDFGKAIHAMCSAYILCPDTPPAVKIAAQRIIDFLVPQLGELQARYDVEVERGAAREKKLEQYKPELQLLPVAPKGTLYDWAVAFLAQARKLGEELRRVESENEALQRGDGKQSLALRSKALGILGRLRSVLQDELRGDKKLAKIDRSVFAYFDSLAQKRTRSAAQAKRKRAKAKSDSSPKTNGAAATQS